MSPREKLLSISLLTAACFLAGIFSTIFIGKPPELSMPGRPTGAPPSAASPSLSLTPGTQISVLLLGVDSLAAEPPGLEACWVITFQVGFGQYYLLGFPPTAPVTISGMPDQEMLATVYAADARIGRGNMFTRDALRALSPGFSIQADGVYDRQALTRTVDLLGGITFHSQRVDGQTLLALYDAVPRDDPAGRLAFQGEALKVILEALVRRRTSPDSLGPYFDLGQQWNPSGLWFAALANTVLPLAPPTFIVATYSPSLAASTPAH